jgi:hypothetical protein
MVEVNGRISEGSIVWAKVPDKNGHEKVHPLVIARITQGEGGTLYHAVAISSTYDKPHPPNQVPVPLDTPGTGLWKDSVIVCDWQFNLKQENIIRLLGRMPISQMRIVAHFLKEKVRTLH